MDLKDLLERINSIAEESSNDHTTKALLDLLVDLIDEGLQVQAEGVVRNITIEGYFK